MRRPTVLRPPYPSATVRVWIALWTVYIVWGSTYLGIRYMVETIPALLGSGVRFFTAGVVFATFLAVRRGPAALRISPRQLAGCAAVGIALLLGGNGLVAVAENRGTPSGLAALVVASVPLWVVLFRRLTGERVARATRYPAKTTPAVKNRRPEASSAGMVSTRKRIAK